MTLDASSSAGAVTWHVNGAFDAAAGPAGPVLLSLSEALAAPGQDLAVRLEPADRALDLAPVIARVALVALQFPAFNDGRGYSQATLLRERLGYRGEIRAVGAVLIDQVPLMIRVGIDSVTTDHAPTIRRLKEGRLPAIDRHYQPAARPAPVAGGYSWRRTAP